MKHQFEGKLSKRDFEDKLCSIYDSSTLSVRPYTEFSDGKNQKMSLYYSNGKHVGTFMVKKSFIF